MNSSITVSDALPKPGLELLTMLSYLGRERGESERRKRGGGGVEVVGRVMWEQEKVRAREGGGGGEWVPMFSVPLKV